MKIAVYIDEKLINHYNILFTLKEMIKVLNRKTDVEDDVYISNKLPEDFSNIINKNYDGLLVRHSFPKALGESIRIPIFAQHEFPYAHIGKLSPDLIYLSDKSYLRHYPRSEEQPFYTSFRRSVSFSKKKYDLLYVGRHFKGKNQRGDWIFKVFTKIIQRKVNDVYSVDELHEYMREKIYLLKYFFLNKDSNGYKQMWHLVHSLRNHRRRLLVDEISILAEKGYKVCFITDELGDKEIVKHDNIDIYKNQDWENVGKLAADSKIVLCQTPMHFSSYNERFTLAIENGALPLCEHYPQYKKVLHNLDELFYDYKDHKVSDVVEKLLQGTDQSIEDKYLKLEQNVKKFLSKEVFRLEYVKFVQKYRGKNIV